ncbi:hypothetical protein TruAng_009628 [Truncatella angustata]|nr:hypothetical protein TruAng_009628 [Truncatella angustata]
MKSPLILGVVLILASQAAASALVNPWQIVFYWYTYRLSVLANDVSGNKDVAATCRGTGPGNSCNFDEFAEYIQARNKDYSPFPKGTIGTDLTPDPQDAVNKINKAAWKSSNPQDPRTLFPAKWGKSKTLPGLGEMLQEAVDIANKIRSSSTAVAKLGGDMTKVVELTNMKSVLNTISIARKQDFWDANTYKLIANALKTDSIDVQPKTMQGLDGKTFTLIDTEALVKGAPNPGDLRKSITNALASNPTTKKIKNHPNAIAKVDEALSDLLSTIACT